MNTEDQTDSGLADQASLRFDDEPRRFQDGNVKEEFSGASDVRVAKSEERHARDMSRELSHRVKNMFAVISGIVNITGRARGIESEAAEINARIQALSRAYETTLDEAASGSIDIAAAIRSVLDPYSAEPGTLILNGNVTHMPFEVVSGVGLVLHELAINAVQHGGLGLPEGRVEVCWTDDRKDDELRILWRESGGPRVSEPLEAKGSGNQIVDRLLNTAGGKIERIWNDSGLEAVITLPTGKVE